MPCRRRRPSAAMAAGAKKWYLHQCRLHLRQDARGRMPPGFIEAGGGTVLGRVRHPMNTQDYSSYLLGRAGLEGRRHRAGTAPAHDLADRPSSRPRNTRSPKSGQKLAAFVMFAVDAHALGLPRPPRACCSPRVSTGTRTTRRPGLLEAATRPRPASAPRVNRPASIKAVRHFLAGGKGHRAPTMAEAINRRDEEDADRLLRQPRRSIREDGRVMYPVTLYEVKKPSASKYAWDTLKAVRPSRPTRRSVAQREGTTSSEVGGDDGRGNPPCHFFPAEAGPFGDGTRELGVSPPAEDRV